MSELAKHNSHHATHAFHYLLRVRYFECDAQRVVFNARYGDYIDLAVTEFVRAIGFRDVLIDGPFEYQLVKQTIEWKLPARFDQTLDVAVSTVRLGTTSFTIAVEFRIAGDEQLVAQAETVYVLADAATMNKATLPDDLRAALTRGAPGVIVDHASCSPR